MDDSAPSFYQLTDYPKVYKRTYWGHFKGEPDPTIIANRNHFASYHESNGDALAYRTSLERPFKKLYGITYDQCGGNKIDHLETYLTKGGRIVVIFSPYHHAEVIPPNFVQIYPLYHANASTFYVIYRPLPRNRMCLLLSNEIDEFLEAIKAMPNGSIYQEVQDHFEMCQEDNLDSYIRQYHQHPDFKGQCLL